MDSTILFFIFYKRLKNFGGKKFRLGDNFFFFGFFIFFFMYYPREKLFAPGWRSDVVLLVICTNRKQPHIKTKVELATTPAAILQPFKNKYWNTLSLLILLSRFTKNSKTQKFPNRPTLFSLPPCIIEEIFLCMNKLYEILN